jgi:streptomycin 3"-adenylyltransferase
VLGPELVGVYVHGSLALGDFAAGQSDVDLVAVCERPLSGAEKGAVAARLVELAEVGALEFHLVTRDAVAAGGEALPFELHVAGRRAVDGAGHGGDPDLVMHYAVLRAHGVAVGAAPPAAELFPRFGREELLRAFAGELRWALAEASPAYQVLNACRAWRFLEEDVLCSKTSGAEWALRRGDGDREVVEAALRHRRGVSDAQPAAEQARAFVVSVLDRL